MQVCARSALLWVIKVQLFLALLVVSTGVLLGQMSPGPLSKAHKDLEGPLSCAKCHAFGAGKAEFKCLDCHQEISRRLAQKRGYHALQVKAGTKSNDCARCHSEHNGLEHAIVRWPGVSREKFDHAQAGFRLEGKHAPLKCDDCHNLKYLDPADRSVLKRVNLAGTYSGLNGRCGACHQDVHQGEFAGSCGDCHSQASWKNPPNFLHSKTKFDLTGRHAQIQCSACHKGSGSAAKVIQFKVSGPFQSCTDCHKDPHANGFGQACERCHTTGSWKQMNTGKQFDHSHTRFPLLGKHADIKCDTCHKGDGAAFPAQLDVCISCHRDPHLGQFSEQIAGSDCKVCHDETGFEKTSYGVAQHKETAYPLAGKHATVECSACHVKKEEHTQFKMAFAACTDCHKDAHNGQFTAAPYLNRCDSCHDVNDFHPSTFGPIEHGKTKFALAGAHAAVPCSGCHVPQEKKELTEFHVKGAHCLDCHKSPHGDLAASFTCEGCHKTKDWQETIFFDHSNTKFALAGRHVAVKCAGCHKVAEQAGVRTVPFAPTSRQCETCHEDPHQGQFKSTSDRVICAECHTANDWRPTQFDHNLHSDFKLDGAHANVPCNLCHERTQVAGKIVITYKGTPRECKQCHK